MLDQIQNFINTATGQTTVIAIVLETIFRLIKTDKPLSIAHIVAATMHKIGDIVSGFANLLDKVLPQQLK